MPGERPIPALRRLRPIPARPFTDLDDRALHPVRLRACQSWGEILNDAKDEFEVDGAAAVFSTWRVEGEDLLDIGAVEIASSMHARAGRLALDTRMADVRATQLLAALPGAWFLLRIKFLWEKAEDDGSLKTSLIQSGSERKKGQGSSRSLGTQSLACLLELTVCSTKMPTLSQQLSTVSSPSETQTRPTLVR